MSNFQQLKDQGLIILYDTAQIHKSGRRFDLNYWQKRSILGGHQGEALAYL